MLNKKYFLQQILIFLKSNFIKKIIEIAETATFDKNDPVLTRSTGRKIKRQSEIESFFKFSRKKILFIFMSILINPK